MAAGDPRRHPGGGGYQRAPVPRRAHAAQLLHSGVLAAQKAVIFGSFTGSAPNDYDAGYDLPQVFDYLRQQLPLPLISGLEFGHEQRTVTLPLGARAPGESGDGHHSDDRRPSGADRINFPNA